MKILWLLLTLFMSSPAMQKKRVKRKCEVIQDTTIKKCPYCDTQQKDLSNHMIDEHKIDRVVLSEWLVDITSLHAIKNSRYDIAGIPCICNRFFRSNKSILRHQKSKDSCPARALLPTHTDT